MYWHSEVRGCGSYEKIVTLAKKFLASRIGTASQLNTSSGSLPASIWVRVLPWKRKLVTVALSEQATVF